MREPTPRLSVTNLGNVTVVELVDRKILDEIAISQIGEQLQALVAAAILPKFVLDFTQVAHLSSSALGMLITLHKRIRERHGELRFCGIGPAIHEVFTITRLNEIFQIHTTREAALGSLQANV